MCLAVPMRVIKIDGTEAMLESAGVRRRGDVRLLDDVKVGDYVILHAGFAIEKLDEAAARETLELFYGTMDDGRKTMDE